MSTLKEIEYTIEMLKLRQVKARKFEKLVNNREFKELILNDYLQDEPARLTSLLVHPQHKDSAMAQLAAVGQFRSHLHFLEGLFGSVDKELKDAEEMHSQMLTEEE